MPNDNVLKLSSELWRSPEVQPPPPPQDRPKYRPQLIDESSLRFDQVFKSVQNSIAVILVQIKPLWPVYI